MKSNHTLSYLLAALILMFIIMHPLQAEAGGYFITDKAGKVISEVPEQTIVVGPTEKTVVFHDTSDLAVFVTQWDADKKTLVIRGNNVHLKIYSSGRIEKWSSFEENGSGQYPIFIEPVIPILPRH